MVAGARWIVLRSAGGALAGLVGMVLLGAVCASPASADSSSGYVSASLYGQAAIFSDPGSVLGGGTQEEWSPAFAGVSGTPGNLTVDTTSRDEKSWDIDFIAPTGQALQPGVYDDAGEGPGTSTPALTASEGSEECGTTGRFEIKDLAYDSSGSPIRFWALFELNCGSGALFGELRFGEPADDATLPSTPSIVRWPANNFWSVGTPVPVLFTASQATTIAGVAVTGTDASDFRVTRDGCTGLELAAAASCSVWVDFDPLAAGTRTASLSVTDSSGATHSVPLQGFTYGGTTRFVAISDPGDQLAQGQSYSFSGPADAMWAAGTPTLVQFAVSDGTDSFQGDFAPPKGQALTTGSSWTDASDYPTDGGSAGMDIGYDDSGCGWLSGQFSVVSATYDANGELTSVDITYQQRCENSTGLLHGELQWRANDDVTPAPWMEPDATGAPSNTGATASSGSPDATGTAGNGQTTVSPAGTSANPNDTTAAGSQRASASSSGAAVPAGLKALSTTLSRDSREAASAVRDAGTTSWLPRALRSIATLQAALGSAQRRLARLAPSAPTGVRHALRRLAAWQATLSVERRVLSLAHKHIPPALRRLVTQANGDATAAVRAISSLERSSLGQT